MFVFISLSHNFVPCCVFRRYFPVTDGKELSRGFDGICAEEILSTGKNKRVGNKEAIK
jgi:hypothetical protein